MDWKIGHVFYFLNGKHSYFQSLQAAEVDVFLEWNRAGWNTSWIKIVRRNISNLRYADDTTLMAESEEELKSLLMKMKEESEKVA